MSRLILASGSNHRLELLREAGFEVDAVSLRIQEPDLGAFSDLHAGLLYVAQLKARAAVRCGVTGLILAADTVGVVAGQIFGKPADRDEARRMLLAISGTTHEVLTGWCLLRETDSLVVGGVERTEIEMRRWTDAELATYLDSGEWIGKSGAYGLQLPSDPFVTRLAGSAANVVGVPIERLRQVLTEFPSLTN